MEKGQLRLRFNVSVRPEKQIELGAKIEIKNMNSISGVRRALAYEIRRPISVLESGEELSRRRVDGRYGWRNLSPCAQKSSARLPLFPNPDLVPVKTEGFAERCRERVPDYHERKRARFVEQISVSRYDAGCWRTILSWREF